MWHLLIPSPLSLNLKSATMATENGPNSVNYHEFYCINAILTIPSATLHIQLIIQFLQIFGIVFHPITFLLLFLSFAIFPTGQGGYLKLWCKHTHMFGYSWRGQRLLLQHLAATLLPTNFIASLPFPLPTHRTIARYCTIFHITTHWQQCLWFMIYSKTNLRENQTDFQNEICFHCFDWLYVLIWEIAFDLVQSFRIQYG